MSARDDFAIWLKGYLDGKPDGADEAVKEKLAEVIGALVAERLRASQYERELLGSTFGPMAGAPLTDALARPRNVNTIGPAKIAASAQGVHWGMQETTTCGGDVL
jgi:hypothetical protein